MLIKKLKLTVVGAMTCLVCIVLQSSVENRQYKIIYNRSFPVTRSFTALNLLTLNFFLLGDTQELWDCFIKKYSLLKTSECFECHFIWYGWTK